jgi:hypothetical protein
MLQLRSDIQLSQSGHRIVPVARAEYVSLSREDVDIRGEEYRAGSVSWATSGSPSVIDEAEFVDRMLTATPLERDVNGTIVLVQELSSRLSASVENSRNLSQEIRVSIPLSSISGSRMFQQSLEIASRMS